MKGSARTRACCRCGLDTWAATFTSPRILGCPVALAFCTSALELPAPSRNLHNRRICNTCGSQRGSLHSLRSSIFIRVCQAAFRLVFDSRGACPPVCPLLNEGCHSATRDGLAGDEPSKKVTKTQGLLGPGNMYSLGTARNTVTRDQSALLYFRPKLCTPAHALDVGTNRLANPRST